MDQEGIAVKYDKNREMKHHMEEELQHAERNIEKSKKRRKLRCYGKQQVKGKNLKNRKKGKLKEGKGEEKRIFREKKKHEIRKMKKVRITKISQSLSQ